MSNDRVDPSGNTGQFQAFAQAEAPAESGGSSRLPLIIGGAVAVAVVLVALVVFLALG
jgi:hypothetical protein